MKKTFMILVAMLGMVLTFTACNGNVGTAAVDNAEVQVENQIEEQVDRQGENKTDIQTENQDNTQAEEQQSIQEENEGGLIKSIESASDDTEIENEKETGGQTEMKMNVQIGDYTFTATLEDNKAVKELVDMMKDGPVTIAMDDYSGFEKVGSLGRSLTTSNSQTTTNAGDIVLYNGNNIVMFYGSNSWSYTRIGKIDDLTDWVKALGSGSITAVFTLIE